MKKFFSVLLVVAVCLSFLCIPGFAEDEIVVLVNGEKVESDVSAQVFAVYDDAGNYVGGRVMLPLRAIGEKLNMDVYWDGETSGITLYRKNSLYVMWLDKDTAFRIDGASIVQDYVMDVLPQVVNERTLVPVRTVSELMGATVEWIPEQHTVSIHCDLGDLEQNSGYAEQCSAYGAMLKILYDHYAGFLNGTLEGINGRFILASGEEIAFKLYPTLAPMTCSNFIKLAKEGFYDGTVFHRVISDFVAQGGGFDATSNAKTSEPVFGEFLANDFFNLMPHKRGALSLARPNDYNMGSSQFFIVQADASHLDGYYATFGRVVSGMEIVDKICAAETDGGDKPLEPIVVKQVIID